MKKLIFLLLITLSCSISNINDAGHANHFKSDNNKSSLSPHTVAMAMVGGAHIHIDYSSPSVRNRIIFGGLLAFNEVWQSGAHNATWIETDYDLLINGNELKKEDTVFSLYQIKIIGQLYLIKIGSNMEKMNTIKKMMYLDFK